MLRWSLTPITAESGSVQSLIRHQGPVGHHRLHPRGDAEGRQHAAAAERVPRLRRADRAQRPRGRELAMARWGMPSPVFALKGRSSDPGVTNVRNVKSPHWRRWLGPENRCVVPFTSFAENELQPDGSRPPVWFAFDESRPLAFFAGIHVAGWKSVRKVKAGEETCDLFAFLTTEPNKEVGAVHPKAMPVILRTAEEIDAWLSTPTDEALKMQKPLPDGSLKIVARGSKKDGEV